MSCHLKSVVINPNDECFTYNLVYFLYKHLAQYRPPRPPRHKCQKNSVDFYTTFVLITEFTLGLSHKFFDMQPMSSAVRCSMT